MTGNNQTPTTHTDAEPPHSNDQDSPHENTDISISDLSETANSTIIKKLFNRIEALEEENKELKQLYNDLDKRVSVLESRADHLNDGIESTEIELRQNKDDITRKHEELKERIMTLEAEHGLGDFDGDTTLTNPSCELETIAQMSEDMRDDELSRSVSRAAIIWNHFEQWSQPVTNGQLLPSSEIRKLLSTRLNTKLEWVQVYRVMEAFNKNTPEKYKIIETNNSGKSLLRKYEDK